MKNSKMLSVNWNEYESCLSSSAKELMDDTDFLDVTLAFDDNQQIQANKFMLSICSPFFRRILKRNSHSHPLLFLKGINSENMKKMIDFIYNGETCVPEHDLESFLSNANDLELKGLSESPPTNESNVNSPENKEEESISKTAEKMDSEMDYIDVAEVEYDNDYDLQEDPVSVSTMNNFDDSISYDTPEIAIVESYTDNNATMLTFFENNMLIEDGKFKCKKCEKVYTKKKVLRTHMQTHMDILHECIICRKAFKTKNSLDVHRSKRVCYAIKNI